MKVKKFLMLLKVEYLPKENRHKEKEMTFLAHIAKVSVCKAYKILTPKRILQRLQLILQIIYFLYRAKKIIKKAYEQYNEFNKIIKTEWIPYL